MLSDLLVQLDVIRDRIAVMVLWLMKLDTHARTRSNPDNHALDFQKGARRVGGKTETDHDFRTQIESCCSFYRYAPVANVFGETHTMIPASHGLHARY